MYLIFYILVSFLITTQVHSLHFYLEGGEVKCFIEEVPKDTLVVGAYKAEEWSESQKQFIENPAVGIDITVDESDNDRVLHVKGASSGRFTFTSVDSGEHHICFSRNHTNGWWSNERLRLHLDMDIGEDAGHDEEDHRAALTDITSRIKELNSRVHDIRREQSYQREREAEFRDMSELANSRVVYWTIVQILVLGATCTWQIRHLKRFFIKKKLV
ncbi:uncharacterized protein VTP21DRAFT_9242 [Calcarisporiella thermophila]|uniref:uncharacterized protein n=1 Tax=Calcarisporiella thermophila TaxID=911321 RepID=UPI0037446B00